MINQNNTGAWQPVTGEPERRERSEKGRNSTGMRRIEQRGTSRMGAVHNLIMKRSIWNRGGLTTGFVVDCCLEIASPKLLH